MPTRCDTGRRAARRSTTPGVRPCAVLAGERVVVVHVGRGQLERGDRAGERDDDSGEDVPLRRADRRRQLPAEELGDLAAQVLPRAVDDEVRAADQVLEVLDQRAVERDRARDRQRRQRRAVEVRQPRELLGASACAGRAVGGGDQRPRARARSPRARGGTRRCASRSAAECESPSEQLPALDLEVAVDQRHRELRRRGVDAVRAGPAQPLEHDRGARARSRRRPRPGAARRASAAGASARVSSDGSRTATNSTR